MPTVLLVTSVFAKLAANQARVLGAPSMAMVALPHPMAGVPIVQALAHVDAALDEIIALLTAVPADVAPAVEASDAAEWIDVATPKDGMDAWDTLQRAFAARGWGDGLPLVPPTEARVAAMVAASGLPADTLVGRVAPELGAATVARIAANAVMAGCQPAHMPLLIAAVQALTDPAFNLKTIQATTHPAAPLLIVGGPLAERLKVHGGSGCFGPGPWANGVIGRAIRLLLLHVGGGRPGDIDKATMGHPGKFSFCIAENEARSPWPSLRAERGYAAEVSTVTVFDAEAPHNINDHESTSAGALMTMITGGMAQIGQNNVYYDVETLLLISPEHAATLAAGGYSKDDIKRAVYNDARVPMARFSRENIERRLLRFLPKRYLDRPADTTVSVVQRWEDVVVVVAGGAGKHSMYLPTTGMARSVTRPILKPDGSPWLPADFPEDGAAPPP